MAPVAVGALLSDAGRWSCYSDISMKTARRCVHLTPAGMLICSGASRRSRADHVNAVTVGLTARVWAALNGLAAPDVQSV